MTGMHRWAPSISIISPSNFFNYTCIISPFLHSNPKFIHSNFFK
jgi:hypothetical protein